jgi:alpha-tubulin suppressor-like RCC1 family protein
VYAIDTAGTVSGLTAPTAIAGGFYDSLALESDGTVWAWGDNTYGELGNGTYVNSNTPVQVSGLRGVRAIAGGYWHNLALKRDGTVWAWGYNFYGELGNGTYKNSNTPVQVTRLNGVIAIAGGGFHSLALKSDGTVWAWGYNFDAELGNGTYVPNPPHGIATPVQVLGPGGAGHLAGVTAIAGGGFHSLALASDGTVWAWGLNCCGELGNGTYTDSNTPVQVSGLSRVTAIAGGADHSLALTSDGTVWAWGYNGYGQLGDGTYGTGNTPVQVNGLSGATAIAGGVLHSLALTSRGTVWGWGANYYGELGNGSYTTGSDTPVQVSGLSGATAIAGGGFHSLTLNGINSLIEQVTSSSLGLSYGAQTSLFAELQVALGYLHAGDTADAIAALRAFIDQVNALVKSGPLAATSAAPLISAAEGIIAAL